GLVVAGSICRDLPPRAAAFVLTGAIVAVTATTIWSIALLAVDFLLDYFAWCRESLHGHGHVHVPNWLGAIALASIVCGAVAVVRSLARQRRARSGPIPEGDLFVVQSDSPTAFAVPGRHPHVVVSTGMLDLLDADEQRAMLAHERAHLRHHHHRLIIATEVAASMLPPLWFPARRVRFATERWADQDAAREIGDATIVARAIARAALARSDASGRELALSGSDVAARIEALTNNPDRSRLDPAPFAVGMLVALSAIAVVTQVHHLLAFIQTFCLS
ncbi:MAG: M56 family metallopeptidase, partial [Acidimicrobiales bacterium]